MNKQELVEAVAEKVDGVSKRQTGEIIDALIDTIEDTVAKGDAVNIIGFGSFKSTLKAEKKARNPQTGKEMVIPAHKSPKFTVGKKFRDKVN